MCVNKPITWDGEAGVWLTQSVKLGSLIPVPMSYPPTTLPHFNRVKIGITLGWNILCLHCIDCSLSEDSPVCLQTPPLYLLVLSSSWVRDEFRMAEFQQFALANVLSLPGQTQHVVPNETNSK